jgi:phosphoglycolate phosphatase
MQADSILFDLDGTLWNATKVITDSWNEILKIKGYHVTSEQVQGVMGLQLPEIGRRFMPDLNEAERSELMDRCCDYECDRIRLYGGRLFDGMEQTLKTLSRKIPLCIVSNCQPGYIEAFLDFHKLSHYFKDFQCAGDDGLHKGENIKKVMIRNGFTRSVYLGDTQGDRDAAEIASIPFIFAAYGFGKVSDYACAINKPEELINIIEF